MRRVDLAALAVEATAGAPVVVLREHDEPHRLLPIFIGGTEAAAIALAVSGQEPPRPLTHDLLSAVVTSLGGHLDAVEVTAVDEGAFVAALSMVGPGGEVRLDARPSDAIALALRLDAPVFVSDQVLDEAGTISIEGVEEPVEESVEESVEVDEEAIDAAVGEFRSFLDDVDPAQFAAEGSTASPDDVPPVVDDQGDGDD